MPKTVIASVWRATPALIATGVASALPAPSEGRGSAHHDIVLVTGQSNARVQYAEGVRDGLIDSGEMPDIELIHLIHNGAWLNRWVTGQSPAFALGDIFEAELWNPEGTALLQQRIDEIESAGGTWSIRGLFWFQGEGDTFGASARQTYTDRFGHLVRSLEAGHELREDIGVVITMIDFNGSEEDLLENGGGRTPEGVEELRAAQLDAARADPTIIAVDSRGWPRRDLWHLGDLTDPRGVYAYAYDFGRREAEAFLRIPRSAGRADLNADGLLDLSDLQGFIGAYVNKDPRSDLALPVGVLDLADILAFVELFVGR